MAGLRRGHNFGVDNDDNDDDDDDEERRRTTTNDDDDDTLLLGGDSGRLPRSTTLCDAVFYRCQQFNSHTVIIIEFCSRV